MCDIWQRQDSAEFPAADLERHRNSLRSLRVQQVVLTGGEPLLHRGLPAILAFFRSLDVRITLLTTGLLLEKHADLLATHVDEVIVSLDGPPAIHNQIRRIPRAFEVIARGIDALRLLRPAMPIACRTTVQRQNHTALRATVDAAHALGADSISFLPADLSSAAFNRQQPWTPDRQADVALSAPELHALAAEIEALVNTHADDLRTRYIREDAAKLRRLAHRFREHLEATPPVAPRCNAPFVSAVWEVDGTLRPCFFHAPTASTAHATLEQALNSNPAQHFRSTLDVASNPTCQRCVCSLNYTAPSTPNALSSPPKPRCHPERSRRTCIRPCP